ILAYKFVCLTVLLFTASIPTVTGGRCWGVCSWFDTEKNACVDTCLCVMAAILAGVCVSASQSSTNISSQQLHCSSHADCIT
ncbi:hypothetical protein Leryth_027660, partial [Lithospermum erythrorhizon]